ncbi:LRR receptor-like serine/threonine-protein kinase HSL2 [Solanum tuberosum]|uniref:LRR receptor-like serine/threonine-protein kinase HSL2 n=1 Tax=Solanum tuberosum TaxID=4113 RepID=UPI00073A4E8B|nr:PREDICTED: LRR receptor-like serine/threonine-protein kinase HSL2 [Solanum tuberosum]
MAPYDALYGQRCRSPIGWFEVGEAELIGLDLVHQAMKKVKIIQERLKTTQSHQKSCIDVRRRDLEFEVYDWVYVKVRKLRTKEVASVKVLWRNQFDEEDTWEAEEDCSSYRRGNKFQIAAVIKNNKSADCKFQIPDSCSSLKDTSMQGASKSFLAECEALRNIRHRNLVKISTICSSVDFDGNDFKALIYPFMENGSLDEWLQPKEGQMLQKRLSILHRLNITIDVASTLHYLHSQCHTSIVYYDLKPNNVLLDNDLTALVSDFGKVHV